MNQLEWHAIIINQLTQKIPSLDATLLDRDLQGQCTYHMSVPGFVGPKRLRKLDQGLPTEISCLLKWVDAVCQAISFLSLTITTGPAGVVDSPLVVGYVFVKLPPPLLLISRHMCGFTRRAFLVIQLNFVWYIII